MMVESLREKSRYSLRGAAVQSYCLAPLLYSIPRLTISDFEQQRRKRVRWQGSVSSLRNLLHNYVNLCMQIVMRGRDPPSRPAPNANNHGGRDHPTPPIHRALNPRFNRNVLHKSYYGLSQSFPSSLSLLYPPFYAILLPSCPQFSY